jgi:hypothetical protein
MYARSEVYLPISAIRSLILLPGAIVGVAATLCGCSPPSGTSAASTTAAVAGATSPAAQATPQYRLTATIQDLMDGIVDPSADVLWDSVAYISSQTGVEDRQPRTEEEWKAVRNSALTLIEAANLLAMPGRAVAGPAKPSDPPAGLGELTHAEVQQRIGATHGVFVQFAHGLQDAGLKALAAIDAKDAQGLMEAGGTIDEACEACHLTYWYPNQTRPGS